MVTYRNPYVNDVHILSLLKMKVTFRSALVIVICLSGSFAGPSTSFVQMGHKRSELRKEAHKMNSDDELEVHHEPMWSLNSWTWTGGFLLTTWTCWSF